MTNILSSIRTGKSVRVSVPKAQFKKLWKWCLKHSEISGGGVNVSVYWSGTYSLKEDKVAKRMGRATPEVRVRSRYDVVLGKNVMHFSTITWSYVY